MCLCFWEYGCARATSLTWGSENNLEVRNQFCPSVLRIRLQSHLSSPTIFFPQQVIEETAGRLILANPASQAHSEFQKACSILQRLRDFLPTSSTSAQVSREGEVTQQQVGKRQRGGHAFYRTGIV